MANDDQAQNAAGPSTPPATTTTENLPTVVEDRAQLVHRARAFLTSPAVQHQDVFAKRRFLLDKGLNEAEIEGLLRELPPQLPAIPPRTYPLPPPSNLPNLLIGIFRLFSWIMGGSAALAFIYYRYFLPKVTQTSVARHSLRNHHINLLRNLTASLATLKEAQAENLTILPKANKFSEPSYFASCSSLKALLKEAEERSIAVADIHPMTLLRCGIQEFAVGKEGDEAKVTTEDLFRLMESHVTWLLSEEGVQYEHTLWETLSTYSIFRSEPVEPDTSENTGVVRWTYEAPVPSGPSPLMDSLEKMSSALPKDTKARTVPLQHTLQSLSDLTGYISAQVYAPYRSAGNASPAAEEFKREVRTLKGLVLNRRSFMPAVPHPSPPISPPVA
ncbi:hypothetical protein BDZ89DRAFT_937963 [Hymenopellis radicata]|nr:hypothetical protein BDZ89DRAFT_937963 [Hymenopellis radicata]